MKRILVVDDDSEARELAADELVAHGYEVAAAADGPAAQQAIEASPPDLVVLDLNLPTLGGLDVLRWIRTRGDVPVIVVSGRVEQADKVLGLELGADDYMVKPFDPRELVARVNTVLRRTDRTDQSARFQFDGLVIDQATRDVVRDGEPLDLTAREFDLLAFLASSPRRVFTRDQILAYVWKSPTEWQDPATVNEHVHRLRRKLERDPGRPKWIETMRGAGYRFTP